MWRDLERSCADLRLPFRRPDPFPQNSLLAARVALVGTLFRAEFAHGRRIDDAAVLADVLAALDVDSEPVLAAAQSDAIKAQLRAQTGEAQRLGGFGAASFTTGDGELVWGNDGPEAPLGWRDAATVRG